MRLEITGRHMEMTDALKIHVENGIGKLRNHLDCELDASAVLSVEKHRHIAEIALNANGVRLSGKESSSDMYASIDGALDKLDKQIRRSKKKERHAGPKIAEAAALPTETEVDEPSAPARELLREQVPIRHMTGDEAAERLALSEDVFHVFSNVDTQQVNVVYRRNDGGFGIIEPQY
jgi:ribosome hibernation promoting factor